MRVPGASERDAFESRPFVFAVAVLVPGSSRYVTRATGSRMTLKRGASGPGRNVPMAASGCSRRVRPSPSRATKPLDFLEMRFPSASVLKAMLLVAYLRHVRDRPLRRSERALLTPMIRRSDNFAATTIRNRIGDGALVRLAHRVGMTRFRPGGAIWGNSQITARDQTRFFLHVDRFVPPRHRAYAMRLLRTVVPSQRWGIGRVELPGWTKFFKAGWGSGTGRVDNQVALLRKGEERVSVAVLTVADGSHAAGKATLRGIFARLLRGLD